MRVTIRQASLVLLTVSFVFDASATSASAAAGVHAAAAHAVLLVGTGSIFSKIVGAVLGAFSWTVGVAGKFILVTVASLVRMLIPRSWAHVPVAVFQWIVAVPDFAGTITSPSGQTGYGFAGVNEMRELLEWIGIALLPLTLTWAGGRAIIGAGDQLAAPVVRLLGLAGVLVFYPFLWGQGAALVDQLTHLILSPAPVTDGIRQLMAYAVEGVALGGWQLIDLALMGAIALELLALIFVKVVVVLAGAILYATGPLLIGLVPTETGGRIVRAWGGAAVALLALPVAWAVIFAIGAVLIGDTSTAGPLIGASSTVGQLLGSVIVAIAGVATLWLCLRASREAGSIFRGQLGVLGPAVRSIRPSARAATAATGSTRVANGQPAASLRGFQRQVRTAATSGMGSMGTAGQRAAGIGGGVAEVGRRGLLAGGATLAGRAARAGVSAARSGRPAGPAPPPPATRSSAGKVRSAARAVAGIPRRAASPWRERRQHARTSTANPGQGTAQSTPASPPQTPNEGPTAGRPRVGAAPLGTIPGGRETAATSSAKQSPSSPTVRAASDSASSTTARASDAAPDQRRSSRRARRKTTDGSGPKPAPAAPPALAPRSDPEDGEG